jgi:hypothetical protein
MDPPIFVVGVEHSGTTILYRMLAQHPDLAWFSQYSMRGGEVPDGFRLPFCAIINRVARLTFGTTWKKKFGLLETLIPNPDEAHRVWNHLIPNTKSFLTEHDYSETLAQAVVELCERECRLWRKDRLLVKLPRLSRAVRLLGIVFPKAFFIHIIRDGKAVALSNEHKFARSPWGEPVALKQSAEFWRTIVQHIEASRETLGKRLITIKYEELCLDVPSALATLLREVGLEETIGFRARLPDRLSITNPRLFDGCSPERKSQLNDFLSQTLEEYGYSLFDISS